MSVSNCRISEAFIRTMVIKQQSVKWNMLILIDITIKGHVVHINNKPSITKTDFSRENLRPKIFHCVKFRNETQVLCPAFALVVFEIPQGPSKKQTNNKIKNASFIEFSIHRPRGKERNYTDCLKISQNHVRKCRLLNMHKLKIKESAWLCPKLWLSKPRDCEGKTPCLLTSPSLWGS